ncbi:M43 family zinc metalloprotease [Aliikangiella coralliicola]|nr:M43 family zinc metalloprotease [Aliikangiella coralliicola]
MKVLFGRLVSTVLLISIASPFVESRNMLSHTSVTDSCGTDHVMSQFYQRYPMEYENAKQYRKESMRKLKQNSNVPDIYTIPVVFHVFGREYNGGTQVDYERVLEALVKTNEDFQGLAEDWDEVKTDWGGEKQKLDIQFKLATIDPVGNPTTGVIFHPKLSGFGHGQGYDEQIQKHAWDNYRYMNVYIMNDLYNDGVLNNSGVAWYPSVTMSDSNLARVVYNGSYLGSNTNENFRSVLTHEFGHWVDLPHTFNGGCNVANEENNLCESTGDYVCDTPQQDNSGLGEGDLNCADKVINWQNFMDYTSQYANFTQGQVDRMLAALQHPARVTLWSDENIAATGALATPQPNVILSNSRLDEDFLNDGSFNQAIQLEAVLGARFAADNGALIEGTDYVVTGLPAGLSLSINLQSNTAAVLTINGNAQSHEQINSGSFSLSWLDGAIEGGLDSISDPQSTLQFNFADAYQGYDHHAPTVSWGGYTHITNVQFVTINNDTTEETYADYTATEIADVAEGDSHSLSITLNKGNSGENDTNRIRVWADWNGDFVFADNELVASHEVMISEFSGDEYAYSTMINIPHFSNTDKNVGLRVMVHYLNGDDGDSAYGNLDSGDVEDYGINIAAETSSVVAEFGVDNFSKHINNVFTFSDLSISDNTITQWQWTFEGGTPETSTEQQPAVVFRGEGQFDVTLTVTDASGNSHTTTKQNFIQPYFAPQCKPTANWWGYAHVAGVKFIDIDNTPGDTKGNGYTPYYNEFFTAANSGETYPLTIYSNSGDSDSDYQRTRAWFDWNGDGIYSDEEAVLDHRFKATEKHTSVAVNADILIPDNAVSGKIMMRILNAFGGYDNQGTWGDTACDNLDSGEYEDYAVFIDEDISHLNSLNYSTDYFSEAFINNGTFENNEVVISTVANARFARSSGALEQGADYVINGLPQGITATITLNSQTSATLIFSGAAEANEQTDNVVATLTWLDPALAGGTASISESTQDFQFSFIDAYTSYDHDYPDISYCCYITTSNVRFGTVDHASENENYSNLTESMSSTFEQGDSFEIEVTVTPGAGGPNDNNRVRIWADWNGDYVFSENELVYSEVINNSQMVDGKYVVRATINIPHYAVTDRQIGLRIVTHYLDGVGGETAYSQLDSGETEDYGLFIESSGLTTIADFAVDNVAVLIRHPVNFNDLSSSEDTIETWDWTFSGGTPESYQGETPPPIVYNAPGVYPVSLTVTDSEEVSHTTTKENLITAKFAPSCVGAAEWAVYGHISGLVFADIENVETNNTNTGHSSYLEEFSTEVMVGSSYQLVVHANSGSGKNNDSQRFKVWIDWNGNGELEESEVIHNETFTAADEGESLQLTTDVAIPDSAVTGLVIMRVMVAYNDAASDEGACATLDSGEFEDYALVVKTDENNQNYGRLMLSDSSFELRENIDSSVTLSISRTGGSDGETKADFNVGNARVQLDQQSLVWASGEQNSQALTINFINDDSNQGNEMVDLMVYQMVNDNLIEEQQVSLTLLDDESNQAPTIDLPDDFEVEVSKPVEITAQVNDAEDETVTMLWAQTAGSDINFEGESTTSIRFDAPSAEEELEFKLTVTDSFNVVTEQSIRVKVVKPSSDDGGGDDSGDEDSSSGGGSFYWMILLLLFTTISRKFKR